MNQLATLAASKAPHLISATGDRAAYRFLEFFTAQIRNPHTRRTNVRAVAEASRRLQRASASPHQGLNDEDAQGRCATDLILALTPQKGLFGPTHEASQGGRATLPAISIDDSAPDRRATAHRQAARVRIRPLLSTWHRARLNYS